MLMFGNNKKTGLAMNLGDIGVDDLDSLDNPSVDDKEEKVVDKNESVTEKAKETTKSKPKPSQSTKTKANSKEQLISLDPKDIEPWEHDDRLPEEIEEDVQDMIRSIQAVGQGSPILVRPSKSKKIKYEEIFGRVRLEACRALGRNVDAIVKDLDDQTAFALQVVENGDRKDISAWSKAVSYKKVLDSGVYESKAAMAARFNRARETVSNLVNLAEKMPESLKDKFTLTAIGQNTLGEMSKSVNQSEGFIDVLLKHKEKIESGKMVAKDIKRLYNDYSGDSQKANVSNSNAKTVSGNKGDYFTISKNNNGAVLINVLKKGRETLSEDEIIEVLKSAMDAKSK